ncbi:MAG: hypothetical protein M9965_00840 [Anaerolineae bacterium]|nr:hypothetical protein [Anaerolineae bacterium]
MQTFLTTYAPSPENGYTVDMCQSGKVIMLDLTRIDDDEPGTVLPHCLF